MNTLWETQELTTNSLTNLANSFQTWNIEYIEESLSKMTDKEKIDFLFEVKKLKQPKENYHFWNKLIYVMILDSLFKVDNGLLEMVIMQLYPDLQLSSASINKLDITIFPKHWMAIRINLLNDDRFIPELLRKAYNSLDSVNPKRVSEIIKVVRNHTREVFEFKEELIKWKLLEWDDILEIIKNPEIKKVLAMCSIHLSLLLEQVNKIHKLTDTDRS